MSDPVEWPTGPPSVPLPPPGPAESSTGPQSVALFLAALVGAFVTCVALSAVAIAILSATAPPSTGNPDDGSGLAFVYLPMLIFVVVGPLTVAGLFVGLCRRYDRAPIVALGVCTACGLLPALGLGAWWLIDFTSNRGTVSVGYLGTALLVVAAVCCVASATRRVRWPVPASAVLASAVFIAAVAIVG